MESTRLQFALQAVFWLTAVVAYVLAVCSQMTHGNLVGVVAALIAHSMVWFAIWFYRLRYLPELRRARP